MRLVCSTETLRDHASEEALNGILHTVGKRWHVLIADLEETRESPWYGDLHRFDRELVDQNLARWAYHQRRPDQGPHRAEITILPSGSEPQDMEDDRWRLPADVAERCAARPLLVFVENQLRDGVFVSHMVRIMRPELPEEVGPGAWEIRNGGGIPDIHPQAADQAQQARADGHWARVVSILDSDSRFPGDNGGGARRSAQCAQGLEEEEGVPCLRLRVRSLENALPNRVLSQWAQSRSQRTARQTEALMDLEDDSRDYFPIDSGWSKSDRWPPEAHDLHAGANRELLAQGVDGIKEADPETRRNRVLNDEHWNTVTVQDIENRLGADATRLVDLVLRWL